VYAARRAFALASSENFGGQTLDTLAIENYISVKETDGPICRLAIEQQVRAYDVDHESAARQKSWC
jgi:alkyl hydroperoxide reductase subunit F